MYKKVKRIVFNYLEPRHDDPPLEKVFNFFIVFLIILNVIMVSIETVDSLNTKYGKWIEIIEDVSVFIFLVEFIEFCRWKVKICDIYWQIIIHRSNNNR